MVSKQYVNSYLKYDKKFPGHHIRIAEEIAKIAKIRKKDSLLEIGVGTGSSSKIFQKYLKEGGIFDGIEISRNMFTVFKKNVKNNKIRKIINGNAKNIEKHFKNRKYDKILCSNSFFCIKEKNEFLKGVQKLLKKDGRFVFSIYGGNIIEFGVDRIKKLLKKYNMEYLRKESKIILIKRSKKAIYEWYKIHDLKVDVNIDWSEKASVRKAIKIWQSLGVKRDLKKPGKTAVMIYAAKLRQ